MTHKPTDRPLVLSSRYRIRCCSVLSCLLCLLITMFVCCFFNMRTMRSMCRSEADDVERFDGHFHQPPRAVTLHIQLRSSSSCSLTSLVRTSVLFSTFGVSLPLCWSDPYSLGVFNFVSSYLFFS